MHCKFISFIHIYIHIHTFRLRFLFGFRKCICNSGNTIREKPSKCSKLFNLIIGGGRSPCCMPCNASVSCLWDIKRMEIRTGAMWYVDKQRRSLLHSINSSSRRDCAGSVRITTGWHKTPHKARQASLTFYYSSSSLFDFPFLPLFVSSYSLILHLYAFGAKYTESLMPSRWIQSTIQHSKNTFSLLCSKVLHFNELWKH